MRLKLLNFSNGISFFFFSCLKRKNSFVAGVTNKIRFWRHSQWFYLRVFLLAAFLLGLAQGCWVVPRGIVPFFHPFFFLDRMSRRPSIQWSRVTTVFNLTGMWKAEFQAVIAPPLVCSQREGKRVGNDWMANSRREMSGNGERSCS